MTAGEEMRGEDGMRAEHLAITLSLRGCYVHDM